MENIETLDNAELLFLNLLEKDIEAGNNLHDATDLINEALELVKGIQIDLDKPL